MMKAGHKIAIIAVAVLVLAVAVNEYVQSAKVGTLNTFATGTVIYPTPVNENFSDIKTSVNKVETDQIYDGTITSVDMNCTSGSDWDLLSDCHGVDNADSQHSHTVSFATASLTINATQVDVADAGGYFTSTDVEGALQELGNHVSTMSAAITTYASASAKLWGVKSVRYMVSTGVLADFVGATTTASWYTLPTGGGEVMHGHSVIAVGQGNAFLYGVKFVVTGTNTYSFWTPHFGGTTMWIYLDGVKEFTMAADVNGDCDEPTSVAHNGGTIQYDGTCLLQKQIGPGTHYLELIYNSASGVLTVSFLTEFLRESTISGVEPYRRY